MPLKNPLKQYRCPFCDGEFLLEESAIISNRTGMVLRAPKPTSFWERLWVEPLDGTVFAAQDARHQCPHCKRALPYRFEVSRQVNLAIVGDSGAGKTHFIIALIEQIKKGAMIQQGDVIIDFSWMDKESENLFQNFYNILFRDKSEIPPTPPAIEPSANAPIIIEPLMFQLTIRSNAQQRTVPIVNITIYDVGGEDIVDQARLTRFGRHIPGADAIIYLADPENMSNVFNQLPPPLRSRPMAQQNTSYAALESVMPIFERWRGLQPGELITTPTAFVISKSDLLPYAIPPQERSKYSFFYNPIYCGKVNLVDIETVDMQARTLLAKLGEHQLLRDGVRFKRVSFFACSATGMGADAQGKYSQVTPLRCLDPFMWLLWQFGALEAHR